MKSATITEHQPKELYTLFMTELWERFGFYTLQTIIILYLTKKLLLPDLDADYLYGAFASLLYITPPLGGYLADKLLGFRRAIIVGAFLLFVGYILCAFPQTPIFLLGLSVLICGNGLLKPNISSIVGELYAKDDPRRQGGFTLFYMGINIGSLIPPLIAHKTVVTFGWHAGFLLAAAGLVIAIITFLLGSKKIQHIGNIPTESLLKTQPQKTFSIYFFLMLGVILLTLFCYVALNFPRSTSLLVEISAIVVIASVVFFLLKEPLEYRHKMVAIIILIALSVGFWALYNQTFTSLMLFADRNMDPNLWGVHLTAELTQFFNPFFIIALSPLLSRLWIKLDHIDKNPSIPLKFALGSLCMCFGFLILAFGTSHGDLSGKVSAWWLVLSYFLQTTGELLISPIGLSMITELSPKHLVGMMMGVWFFASSTSFAIGGSLASLADIPEKVSPLQALMIYNHAFSILASLSVILVLLSFSLVPYLKKLITTN